MPFTRTNTIRLIRLIIVLIFVGLIVAYAISRSLTYVSGPYLEIYSPSDGTTTSSSTITISGRVLRVNEVSLNGNNLSFDEQGNWSETIILFEGLNRITIEAGDQFGRHVKKTLDLVGMDLH